jgi:Tfp pilus assembly protein PilN/Tfp pilus assembly PilM family ATPase
VSPLNYCLGISVDDGVLHLLGLRSAWGTVEGVGSLRVPLPAVAEAEGPFLQEIAKFLLAHRIPPGVQVVLGAPRGEFLLRRFTIPPVKARLLPALVEFEIERHLPGKREEFLCGWRVEGKVKGGGHAILLGAARREQLSRPLALLRRANVEPRAVLAEPLALSAAFRRHVRETDDALLLDLGLGSCGLDTLRAGRLDASRSISLEGTGWRESFPGAEREEGGGASESRQSAALKVAELLAAKIRHPLFLASLPGGKIPEVRLLGYGVNRSVLVEKLQNELRVPVRVFSPWQHVRFATPPADLAAFTAPLLLALHGLRERAPLRLSDERQEVAHAGAGLGLSIVLGVLLAAILVTSLASFGMRQRRQLALIDGEIRRLKVQMAAVDAVDRRLQEQRTRLQYLRGTIGGRTSQAAILKELTTLILDDSYLSEYTFKGGSVEITGFSPSASKLLPLLEASPLFTGVEFSAPIVAQGGGLERFRIRMKLEKAVG